MKKIMLNFSKEGKQGEFQNTQFYMLQNVAERVTQSFFFQYLVSNLYY